MPLKLGGLGPEGQTSSRFEELLSSSQPRGRRGQLEFVRRRSENIGQQVCLAFSTTSPADSEARGGVAWLSLGYSGRRPLPGKATTCALPLAQGRARQVVRPALWLLGRGREAPRGLDQVAAPRSPHWPQVPPASWIGRLDGQVPPPSSAPPAPRTAQVPRSWRDGCRLSREARSLPRAPFRVPPSAPPGNPALLRGR